MLRKTGLVKAVKRPNLTSAVSQKHLSDRTKNYIFMNRVPRVVYRIFLGFFKILIIPTPGRYLQTPALKNCSFCSSMSVFAASSAIVLTSSPLLSAWHGMVNLAHFAELSLYISLNAKLLVRLIRSPLVIVSLFFSYGNKCLQFRFTL